MNAPLPAFFIPAPPSEIAARLAERHPPGWRRPAMAWNIKCEVAVRQHGRCKITGERLGNFENVHFDHRPALVDRRYDPVTCDVWPASNDPRFIDAVLKNAHQVCTTRDLRQAAKDKRIARAEARRNGKPVPAWAVTRGKPKPKREIRSRGFSSGKRTFRREAWP